MKTRDFGSFFKELRLKKELSLRAFCIKANADAGNISKMERGVIVPPGDDILKRYANVLEVVEGSNDWFELFDLAAVAKMKIPSDIAHNEKTTQLLPVFFRTLRNQQLDEAKMLKLAEKLKEAGL